MYLKRKIDDSLLKWKNDPSHLPIILYGPRQVGKTESVIHFSSNYKSFININFAIESKYRTIISDGYDVNTIIKNISRIDPSKKFMPHETLILFDEIQDFPELLTSLKSFAIDKRYDVICSGSMLGINYSRIASNSIGFKTEYYLGSLDFEEFLAARGYGDEAVEDIYSHMTTYTPFSKTDIDVFFELFLDYTILGGMPRVVLSYIERGTFEDSLEIQRGLINGYREDIRKYVTGLDKARILNVYNHVPMQLAKENKKFQISKVASGAKFKYYWGAIEWLSLAGLVNIAYCLNYPSLPLKGNYQEDKYKIYYKDTGLLVACLDDEAQADLRANKNMNVYKGALYENAVGEALSKQGYGLFYYKKENSTLEEDFFLRTKKSLVPIEVKAGSNKSKSLSTLVKDARYEDITHGIKLIKGNVGIKDGIITFPYFCAFLLRRYLSQVDF